MIKKILCLISVLSLAACATPKQENKLDIVAQADVKKEYVLPKLTSCDSAQPLTDKTLKGFYQYGAYVKGLVKTCSELNDEKTQWIIRNFPAEAKQQQGINQDEINNTN